MMRMLFLIAGLGLAALVSLPTSTSAAPSPCSIDRPREIAIQVQVSPEIVFRHDEHGHDHETCCWDSFCFDPAHCHHVAAPGLIPPVSDLSAALVGHGVFQSGLAPAPRPIIPRIDVDPPRA